MGIGKVLTFGFALCGVAVADICDPAERANDQVDDRPGPDALRRKTWFIQPLGQHEVVGDRIRWRLILQSPDFRQEVQQIDELWARAHSPQTTAADCLALIRAVDRLRVKWREVVTRYPPRCGAAVSSFLLRLRASCHRLAAS